MKSFDDIYEDFREKKGLKADDKVDFEEFVEEFKNNPETKHITKNEVFDWLLEKGRKLVAQDRVKKRC
jgi:hypothetical protein